MDSNSKDNMWERYLENLKPYTLLNSDEFTFGFSRDEHFPYILLNNEPHILLEHLMQYIIEHTNESDKSRFVKYLPTYTHSRNGYWIRNREDDHVKNNIIIQDAKSTHKRFLQIQESCSKSKKSQIFLVKDVLLHDEKLTIKNITVKDYASNFYTLFVTKSKPETPVRIVEVEERKNPHELYSFVSFEDHYLDQISNDFKYTCTRTYNNALIDIRANRQEYFNRITDKIIENINKEDSLVSEMIKSRESVKKIKDFRSKCNEQLEKIQEDITKLTKEAMVSYDKRESYFTEAEKLRSLNPNGKTLNKKSIDNKIETMKQFSWFYIRLYVSLENADTREKLRVPDIVPIVCSTNALKIVDLYLTYCRATRQVQNKTTSIRKEHILFVCGALGYFVNDEDSNSLKTLCDEIDKLKIHSVIRDRSAPNLPPQLLGEAPEYEQLVSLLQSFHMKVINNYETYIAAVKEYRSNQIITDDFETFATLCIVGICSRIAARLGMILDLTLGKNVKTIACFMTSDSVGAQVQSKSHFHKLKSHFDNIDCHLCINAIRPEQGQMSKGENVHHKTSNKDLFIYCPPQLTIFLYDIWAILICADLSKTNSTYKTFLNFRKNNFDDNCACIKYVATNKIFDDALKKEDLKKKVCLVGEKKVNQIIRQSFKKFYKSRNLEFSQDLNYHVSGIRKLVCHRIQQLKTDGHISDNDIDLLCPGVLAHSRNIHNKFYATSDKFFISPQIREIMDNLWSINDSAQKDLGEELAIADRVLDPPPRKRSRKSNDGDNKQKEKADIPDSENSRKKRISTSGRIIRDIQRY